MIALCAAHQEPLVFPSREQVEARLEATTAYWRRWAAQRAYDGPWRDAVIRSALALKLLFHAPSGAIAAAATTSLPEEIGGERNWDYRFCWVRDSAFTLDALLQLGCPGEAEAFFWWLLHASQLTHPRLQVLYRLDGGERAPERTLELDGYQGSRPVRVGNDAAAQTQLDIYGDLLQAALVYARRRRAARPRDRPATRRDRRPRLPHLAPARLRHLGGAQRTRALHPLQDDVLGGARPRRCVWPTPGTSQATTASTWRREGLAIREFIETRCWSERLGSYTRQAGGEELDASLLLGVLFGYDATDPGRLAATVDALRRELGRGPLLSRYSGEDGLRGAEGAFLCCSFWLADALARIGRLDEATEPDGPADRAGQRRRPVRRGDRPSHRRAAGQHPAGAGASRPHQRRGHDLQGERSMTVWGALAGGFVGTLVLTTGLRTANELGLTRVDLPFLLGTAFTRDRARAKALGYLLHLAAGEVFALVYYAIFAALDTSGWLLGALLGLLHGIVSATALVNILLPVVHPRMGSALSAADSSPLLEPPGFLLRNYGRGTPIATLLAHIAYGAIVGGFASIAG